jgi:hypothetical protein
MFLVNNFIEDLMYLYKIKNGIMPCREIVIGIDLTKYVKIILAERVTQRCRRHRVTLKKRLWGGLT